MAKTISKKKTAPRKAAKAKRSPAKKVATKRAPVKKTPPAPPAPPKVLRSRFILRELATDHAAFLKEYQQRPRASQSTSGAVNQILTLFPKVEADLREVTADRDKMETLLRFYVGAAKRSAQASEEETKALADLISFVRARPVDYQRQFAMDLPFDDGDDDGDDD